MSDLYYDVVRAIGSAIFWQSSRPIMMHRERTDRAGAFIVAGNHHSPFDVPLTIRHSRRRLDYVTVTEAFKHRFVAWFYGGMNAFPVDRSKVDPTAVRKAVDRLKRGRAVAMFPEGAIRRPPNSVTHGGRFRPGVARLAQMADVPVMPCVVANSDRYLKIAAWLPHRQIRYGIIFGEPIFLRQELDKSAAVAAMEADLSAAFVRLWGELTAEMRLRGCRVE